MIIYERNGQYFTRNAIMVKEYKTIEEEHRAELADKILGAFHPVELMKMSEKERNDHFWRFKNEIIDEIIRANYTEVFVRDGS